MRKILVFSIVLIICSSWMFCDDTNNLIKEQIEQMDINVLQQYVDKINLEAEGYMPNLNAKEIVFNILDWNHSLNIKDILTGLVKIFLKEIVVNLSLLGKIIILSVFCAFLQNLHGAFESESISKLALLFYV